MKIEFFIRIDLPLRLFFKEASRLSSPLQSILVHLSRKHEICIPPHPLDESADPPSLLGIPIAVRPPVIHTTLQHVCAQLSMLTLLVEDM